DRATCPSASPASGPASRADISCSPLRYPRRHEVGVGRRRIALLGAARVEDRNRIRRQRLGTKAVVGRIPAGRTSEEAGALQLVAGPLHLPLQLTVEIEEAARIAVPERARPLRVDLGMALGCEAAHQYTEFV